MSALADIEVLIEDLVAERDRLDAAITALRHARGCLVIPLDGTERLVAAPPAPAPAREVREVKAAPPPPHDEGPAPVHHGEVQAVRQGNAVDRDGQPRAPRSRWARRCRRDRLEAR